MPAVIPAQDEAEGEKVFSGFIKMGTSVIAFHTQ